MTGIFIILSLIYLCYDSFPRFTFYRCFSCDPHFFFIFCVNLYCSYLPHAMRLMMKTMNVSIDFCRLYILYYIVSSNMTNCIYFRFTWFTHAHSYFGQVEKKSLSNNQKVRFTRWRDRGVYIIF